MRPPARRGCRGLPSLRAVGSTIRKPACRPPAYKPRAGLRLVAAGSYASERSGPGGNSESEGDDEHRRGGDRGKRRWGEREGKWGERERWTQGDREETEMKLITKTHMRLPKRLQIVIGATGNLRKDNF